MTSDDSARRFPVEGIEHLRFQIDEHWLPICPLGLPQVARPCLGYYERGAGRLQLRFPALDTEGVCDVVLDEQPSRVVVRVVLCYREDELEPQPARGFAEERTHRDLDRPLADRPVIDFETGEAVPFYVPTWRHGRRTTRPGYYTDRAASIAAAELLPQGVDPPDVLPRGALPRSRTLGW